MTLKSYERPKGRVKPDTGIGSDSPHVTVARHDDGSSTITEHANLAAAKAHIDSHNKSNPSTPIMAWPKKEADRLSKDANTAKAFGFNNPSKEPRKHADESKSSDIKKWASSKTGGDSGGGYSHWKGGSK